MAEILYSTGVFNEFKASVRFHLGKLQTDVYKDAVVQFDGSTLKMDGVTHSIPELRSAIKAGWLTPVGTNVGDYVPQSANVRVRAAMDKDKGKTVSTEVQHDETFVSVAKKPTTTDGVKLESKVFNATLVRDTEGDGRSVGSATKKVTESTKSGESSEGEPVATLKTAAKRSFSVDGSTSMTVDADETGVVEHLKGSRPVVTADSTITREGQSSEGGRIIANVKTAAKRKVTLTDANSADREISKLDNSTRLALAPKGKRDIAALAGDTLEEIVPANEPENRGKFLAEQAKAKRLAALKDHGQTEVRVVQEEPLSVVEFDAVPPEEGDLPDPEDSPIPVRVIVAKPPKSIEDFAVNGEEILLAPGVRWDKRLHWKTRVKQALQYRGRPEILDLIRGCEVPSVVKSIDEVLAAAK